MRINGIKRRDHLCTIKILQLLYTHKYYCHETKKKKESHWIFKFLKNIADINKQIKLKHTHSHKKFNDDKVKNFEKKKQKKTTNIQVNKQVSDDGVFFFRILLHILCAVCWSASFYTHNQVTVKKTTHSQKRILCVHFQLNFVI